MKIGILNSYQDYTSKALKTFKSNETSPASEDELKSEAIEKISSNAAKFWFDQFELPEFEDMETEEEVQKAREESEIALKFREALKAEIKGELEKFPNGYINMSTDRGPDWFLGKVLKDVGINVRDYDYIHWYQKMYIHDGKIEVRSDYAEKNPVYTYELPPELKAALEK